MRRGTVIDDMTEQTIPSHDGSHDAPRQEAEPKGRKDDVPRKARKGKRPPLNNSTPVPAYPYDGLADAPDVIGLFGRGGNSPRERYHLTGATRRHRLRQMLSIVRRYDVIKGLTPTKLRAMLEELGPTFVKVGQILSMRSEILPQSFCDELSKLRADAEPMDAQTVIDTLEHEYGRPIDEVFASIDRTPLGSASVAQVHRAKLATGEDVAVKVQRPGIQEMMAQDIDIMRSLVRRLGGFLKGGQIVDFADVVEELWESFQEETDFLVEARNLREFHELNADCVYVDCPKPYMRLCTRHVVVMDYVDGISLSHPDRLVKAGYDLGEIGTKLVDNYATQVLDEGFFHADPHPENIVVSGGKIIYLDLGMTGRINARQRRLMRDMIFAVGRGDIPTLKDALLSFAQSPDMSSIDQGALMGDLDAIVRDYGDTDLKDLDISEFMTALMSLAKRNHVEVPGTITLVGRGLVTLEGVLDEFLPDTNMVQIIARHIASTKSFDKMARDELAKLGVEGHSALHGALGALSEAKLAATMLTRGQIKTNIELVGSERPLAQLSEMVDRMVVALLIAGLFVGSSIVYYAGIKPVIFGIPVLGFFGYAVSGILALWLVFDIIFKRHRR